MAEVAQNQDYPVANQLDVGTNAVEDRVVLIASTKGHGRRAVLLTRRMMKALLAKYASVLEQTSETASQAAADHKAEVLQMEHVSAVSQGDHGRTEESGPGAPANPTAPDAVYLGTDVHFQQRDGQILLAFDGVQRTSDGPDGRSKEPVVGFLLDRTNAHKVLALLKDKADEAGWDLPKPSGWTDKLTQATARSVN
jgi:hypothetical protein